MNPRYLAHLNDSDTKKQRSMILKSRRDYKEHHYFTRKKLPSFKGKLSPHIVKARAMYHTEIFPNKELAKATGCPVSALKAIVRKGEGAYYSSGSRPNQTPFSWGIARLASALTHGKASMVDKDILKRCN